MRRRARNRWKLDISRYKGKRGNALVKVLLALVLAGVLCFAATLGVVLSGSHDDVRGEPSVMVVLGCQVKPWGPSVLLQDRIDTAWDYWQDHPDTLLVVTGSQGPDEPVSEARCMADSFLEKGVPEEQILLEEKSQNTVQNLRYARDLLAERGYDVRDGVIIVSNGFHLTRAKMLAGRVGYENVSVLAAPSSHLPSRLKM